MGGVVEFNNTEIFYINIFVCISLYRLITLEANIAFKRTPITLVRHIAFIPTKLISEV